MNFTTLIMLIFTPILATGLVLKGLNKTLKNYCKIEKMYWKSHGKVGEICGNHGHTDVSSVSSDNTDKNILQVKDYYYL